MSAELAWLAEIICVKLDYAKSLPNSWWLKQSLISEYGSREGAQEPVSGNSLDLQYFSHGYYCIRLPPSASLRVSQDLFAR